MHRIKELIWYYISILFLWILPTFLFKLPSFAWYSTVYDFQNLSKLLFDLTTFTTVLDYKCSNFPQNLCIFAHPYLILFFTSITSFFLSSYLQIFFGCFRFIVSAFCFIHLFFIFHQQKLKFFPLKSFTFVNTLS